MKIHWWLGVVVALTCGWASSAANAALVAYYPFNGSGDDLTGTNTNLSLVGDAGYGASVSSGMGTALSLDGDGDGAIGQNFVKVTTNNLSVVAWANASSLDGDWNTLVKNWGVTAGGQFHFGLGSGGINHLQSITTGGNAESPGDIPAGEWIHTAFVLDAGTEQHRLYINGTMVASSVYLGTLTPGTASITGLGVGVKPNDDGSATGDASGPGYWNGLIDDVGIYDEALDDAQIMQIYQNGLAGIQLDGTSVPEPNALLMGVVVGMLTVGGRLVAGGRRRSRKVGCH